MKKITWLTLLLLLALIQVACATTVNSYVPSGLENTPEIDVNNNSIIREIGGINEGR